MHHNHKIIGIALYLATPLVCLAEQPICTNPIEVFTDSSRDQVVATIRSAHRYFMESADPSAGKTYNERTSNFDAVAAARLREYKSARTAQYSRVECKYEGSDNTTGRGARSNATIKTIPGQYFIIGTLERTTNGDWKGGPQWAGDSKEFPISLTWTTGGYRPANTFVKVTGKYIPSYITQSVEAELSAIRKVLADSGIATTLL